MQLSILSACCDESGCGVREAQRRKGVWYKLEARDCSL